MEFKEFRGREGESGKKKKKEKKRPGILKRIKHMRIKRQIPSVPL